MLVPVRECTCRRMPVFQRVLLHLVLVQTLDTQAVLATEAALGTQAVLVSLRSMVGTDRTNVQPRSVCQIPTC